MSNPNREFARFCLSVVAGIILARPCVGLDLVVQRKPTATIVVPARPLAVESYAAQELQYHVKASTGAELKIVSEDNATREGAHVFLGHCRRAAEVMADPSPLPGNGYLLKTVGRDLFIVGHDSDGDALNANTHAGTLFAVYDLLEKYLEVRWLWPGKLGEVIPRHLDLTLPPLNATVNPLLWFKVWRGGLPAGRSGQSDLGDEFSREQAQWLRRQRFGRSIQPDYGHSFNEYWARFGKSHPEFFALMPDGTRGPDPLDVADGAGNNGSLMHMCVSERGLWKQIIEDWKGQGTPEFLNICENDGYPGCVCERCLSWDAPDPGESGIDYWPYTFHLAPVPFDKRLEAARRALENKDEYWMLQLGSLSQRYARFYQAVLEEARRIRPDAKVVAYVYDNYRRPPTRPIQLGPGALLGFVPWAPFPYNQQVSERFQREWSGWAATDASLFLRPNYTLDGHNLPVFCARQLGEDLKFALAHSLKGADFDSLTGQYSTQGPTLYMLSYILNHPDASTEGVLDDYCEAFGPAKEAVKRYFQHWETVTQGVSMEKILSVQQAKRKYGNSSFVGLIEGPEVYTHEVIRQGWAILAAARKQAAADPRAMARVEWLATGLKHVDLVLAAEKAYERGVDSGDRRSFQKAYEELTRFRARNTHSAFSDVHFLGEQEKALWKP